MNIKKEIQNIIRKYDNRYIDKCIEDIEWYMDRNKDVKQYKIYPDTDYISISWLDINDDLNIYGEKLYIIEL